MRRTMSILLFSFILILGGTVGPSATAAQLQVGAESQFYRDTAKPNFFPILKASVEGSGENSEYDLQFQINPSHPQANALTSKNANYQFFSKDSSFQLSVGRKWALWSEADEIWDSGILNPLNSWDRLRPTSQGLTGLFLSGENESIRFQIFGSYLMIPESTPNVVIENSQFQYYHPQSISAGPQTYELLDRPTPMGYQLNIPSLSKILLRPSILGSIESKTSLDPVHIRVTAGYLPLNYFPVALQAALTIPLDQIVVDLHPRLLSHAVYSTDLSIKMGESARLGLSAIRDEIISEKSLPTDYTASSLGATNYWSPWLKIGPFCLAQVFSNGGLGPDIGPNANPNPDQNLFSSRILFRNATQLTVELDEFTARYLHEYSVRGDWFALDWKKQWTPNWSTVLGGDVLNADRFSSPDRGAEFLGDLRALDRIRLGVNYAL
jgi:hypothetical protein